MIRYTLRCDNNHDYDSWFQSSESYLQLRDAAMLSCPLCGSSQVEKAMMAPQVTAGTRSDAATEQIDLDAPMSRYEEAVQELRKTIETHSEDVGRNFAREARAIASGEAPRRTIRGESHHKEARGLIEDGIAVLPLPWSHHVNTH